MRRMGRRELLRWGGAGLGAALGSCATARTEGKTSTSGRFDRLQPWLDGMAQPEEKDYEERRERLRRELRRAEAKALLVAGTPSLRYFTGVSWGLSDRFFGTVLFEEGEAAWIVPAFEKARALESIPEAMEVRAWEEDEDPMAIVGEILRSRDQGGGPLAIEVETPHRYVERIAAASPGLRLASGFEPVRRCRMVKTERELAWMRRASEITKRAIREAARHLTEGMTEEEFAGLMGEAHRKLGASSPWALVLFGPNAAFPHGTKEKRRLREGELVLCDTGASLYGYQSDVTRTWCLGKPSDRQRKIWETVKNAQEAARREFRPGNPCENVDGAARQVVEEAGFGPGYKFFHHRLGHGIGIEGHEEPYMVRGNKLPLETGMTSSDEPGIYIYGELGVRLEDVMVVTENGGEFLGPASADPGNPL